MGVSSLRRVIFWGRGLYGRVFYFEGSGNFLSTMKRDGGGGIYPWHEEGVLGGNLNLIRGELFRDIHVRRGVPFKGGMALF